MGLRRTLPAPPRRRAPSGTGPALRALALAAALPLLRAAAAAAPPFNATTVNHVCTVTRDFNATAKAYAWLFGAAAPTGAISEHSWLWYRGANTSALAMLVHAPMGPAGFTLEIISPLDDKPSIYNELLGKQGNSVQHMGINVDPPGSIAAAAAAFAAQGYETVFAGQGSWGCFVYVWMRDDLGTIIELLDHGNMNCRAPS